MACAAWTIAPIYVGDTAFADKLAEVAKLKEQDDDISSRVLTRLLDPDELAASLHADEGTLAVTLAQQRIRVEYDRTVMILPGLRRAFHFVHEVELSPPQRPGADTSSRAGRKSGEWS